MILLLWLVFGLAPALHGLEGLNRVWGTRADVDPVAPPKGCDSLKSFSGDNRPHMQPLG